MLQMTSLCNGKAVVGNRRRISKPMLNATIQPPFYQGPAPQLKPSPEPMQFPGDLIRFSGYA
jgi:hypothetical protein